VNLRAASAIRLGFLVWDVSRLWRVVLDRALKPLGVTRSQYSIIAFLSRRDGMTQTAVAPDLALTKVAGGGLLERMEAVGLVERRADESDARVRRVYLTRKGTRITQKIRELVDPIEAEMLAPIGDAELDGAIHTLAVIKGMLLELGDGNGAAANPPKQRKG
jgi:DNA-binding MarR family transcriptional regulator